MAEAPHLGSVTLGELYVSEKTGDDTSADGTETKPFQTVLQAMKHYGKEPFPTIYVDGKEDEKWAVCSQSQLKKVTKIFNQHVRKVEAASKKEAEDVLRREKNLEDAKKIVITPDSSLPEATESASQTPGVPLHFSPFESTTRPALKVARPNIH